MIWSLPTLPSLPCALPLTPCFSHPGLFVGLATASCLWSVARPCFLEWAAHPLRLAALRRFSSSKLSYQPLATLGTFPHFSVIADTSLLLYLLLCIMVCHCTCIPHQHHWVFEKWELFLTDFCIPPPHNTGRLSGSSVNIWSYSYQIPVTFSKNGFKMCSVLLENK